MESTRFEARLRLSCRRFIELLIAYLVPVRLEIFMLGNIGNIKRVTSLLCSNHTLDVSLVLSSSDFVHICYGCLLCMNVCILLPEIKNILY